MKKYYCIECKKNQISYTNWMYGNKRCQPCANKISVIKRIGVLNGNYTDGRSLKHYYCKCGKKICWSTAINGEGRCQSCAKQGNGSSLYIDGRSSKKLFCKDCGKELGENARWQDTKRCKSCSKKGELSVNWVEDRKLIEYTLEFTDELKEKIRIRDNYTCQNCGMTEEEHLIVYGKDLIVHHIDYNKHNCKEDNLITTCFGCNIRANFNKDYWKSFYQNEIKVLSEKK